MLYISFYICHILHFNRLDMKYLKTGPLPLVDKIYISFMVLWAIISIMFYWGEDILNVDFYSKVDFILSMIYYISSILFFFFSFFTGKFHIESGRRLRVVSTVNLNAFWEKCYLDETEVYIDINRCKDNKEELNKIREYLNQIRVKLHNSNNIEEVFKIDDILIELNRKIIMSSNM